MTDSTDKGDRPFADAQPAHQITPDMIYRYVAGVADAETCLNIDRQAAEDDELAAQISALAYLRHHFDEVSKSAAELLGARPTQDEEPSYPDAAESRLGLKIIVDQVRGLADIARGLLPADLGLSDVSPAIGVGSPESLEVEKLCRESREWLTSDRPDEAIHALMSAAQIEPESVRTAHVQVVKLGKCLFEIGVDSRRGVVSVIWLPGKPDAAASPGESTAPVPATLVLLPRTDDSIGGGEKHEPPQSAPFNLRGKRIVAELRDISTFVGDLVIEYK